MAEPHDRDDEDIEHALLVADIAARESGLDPEASVVHEHRDRPVTVHEPLLDNAELLPIRQVGGEDFDRHPVGTGERLREGRKAVLVAGDEDKIVPALGKEAGEGLADSGCRAGDEGGAIDSHGSSSHLEPDLLSGTWLCRCRT